jgi:hypothetical protein
MPELAEYVDLLRTAWMLDEHAQVFIEKNLDVEIMEALGEVRPGMVGGTPDAVVVLPTAKEIWIIDLKWGKGVEVYPEGNLQLHCYFVGAVRKYKAHADWVPKFIIVQPRTTHGETIRVHAPPVNVGDMYRAAVIDLKHIVGAAEDPAALLVVGEEQCRFCEAGKQGKCPAREKAALAMLPEIVDDDPIGPTVTDPELLPVERLAEIVAQKGIIKKWLEQAEGVVGRAVAAGRTDLGFKWVAGRSRRNWKAGCDDKIADAIKAAGGNPFRLVTLTDAQKMIGKKAVDAWAEKADGKPTLAPVADKRPALASVNLDLLPEIEDDEE